MTADFLRGERGAISAYFALMGFVCAAWASSIPDLKEILSLDDAGLGLLLTCGPAGTAVSYLFVGFAVTRLGSRRMTLVGAAGYALSTAAVALGFLLRPPVPFWCAVIALTGAFGNILNVGANTQGGLAQMRAGRSVMGTFHAVWSASNLAGALFALAASNLAVPVWSRVAVAASAASALAVAGAPRLIPKDAPPDDAGCGGEAGKGWRIPDATLVSLGFMALVFMGCEGSIYDWVGVFYKDVLLAPQGRVLWGYCAVMAAMAVGRFVTDSLVDRFTSSRVVRAYCLFVFAGLSLALSSPSFLRPSLALHLVATAGYALAGLGVSGLVPIVYARASATRVMSPGAAVTLVASFGFLGFFAAPPLIGAVSKRCGLAPALAIFAVLILAGLFMPKERDK